MVVGRMPELDLDAIEKRASAATEGPWLLGDGFSDESNDADDWAIRTPSGFLCASPDDGVRGSHDFRDATFIVHAREDVPALVAEVRRLREENANRRRGGSVPPEVTT